MKLVILLLISFGFSSAFASSSDMKRAYCRVPLMQTGMNEVESYMACRKVNSQVCFEAVVNDKTVRANRKLHEIYESAAEACSEVHSDLCMTATMKEGMTSASAASYCIQVKDDECFKRTMLSNRNSQRPAMMASQICKMY